MVIQIAVLVIIPILFGVVTVSPFDDVDTVSETEVDPAADFQIIFLVLWAFWLIILLRILVQIKKGTFRMRGNTI